MLLTVTLRTTFFVETVAAREKRDKCLWKNPQYARHRSKRTSRDTVRRTQLDCDQIRVTNSLLREIVSFAILLLPGRVILLHSLKTLSNCRLTDGFEKFLDRFVRHLPHTMTRSGSRRHIFGMYDHPSSRNNQLMAVVTRMHVFECVL